MSIGVNLPTDKYACPCCGHHTLPGRTMDDLCPVCSWRRAIRVGHPSVTRDQSLAVERLGVDAALLGMGRR